MRTTTALVSGLAGGAVASSSLLSAKGVASPARNSSTYAPYDGLARFALVFAQPEPSPTLVLAKK